MYCCYIIFSKQLDRFYIGACHNDLDARIKKHNSHEYGEHRFTSKAEDWELFLTIECDSFTQAVKIERHIKSMKSSIYIKNLSLYPEMVIKLIEKFKG